MDCWEVAFIWASYSLCDTLLQNDLVSFNPLVVSWYCNSLHVELKGTWELKKLQVVVFLSLCPHFILFRIIVHQNLRHSLVIILEWQS